MTPTTSAGLISLLLVIGCSAAETTASGPDTAGGADAAPGRDTAGAPGSDSGVPAGGEAKLPVEHGLVTSLFDTARDFGFDGRGHIASRKYVALLEVDGAFVNSGKLCVKDRCDNNCWFQPSKVCYRYRADSPHTTGAIRYRPSGELAVTLTTAKASKHIAGLHIAKAGAKVTAATLVIDRSGVLMAHTDAKGRVWVSARATRDKPSALLLVGPAPANRVTTVLQGSSAATSPVVSPYGIVYDQTRKLLFFTDRSPKGPSKHNQVMKLRVTAKDDGGIVEVGKPEKVVGFDKADGAWGLTLDERGRLYVVVGVGDRKEGQKAVPCGGRAAGAWKTCAAQLYAPIVGDTATGDVFRLTLDAKGALVGQKRVNAKPIPRAVSLQFGNGPGFDDKGLYVISWPLWGGLGVGMYPDNTSGAASPLVRLKLGVKGDPNGLAKP